MTDIRKVTKGEKINLPLALAEIDESGWSFVDPKVDGLLIIPRPGVAAALLTDADLEEFGYTRKKVSKKR